MLFTVYFRYILECDILWMYLFLPYCVRKWHNKTVQSINYLAPSFNQTSSYSTLQSESAITLHELAFISLIYIIANWIWTRPIIFDRVLINKSYYFFTQYSSSLEYILQRKGLWYNSAVYRKSFMRHTQQNRELTGRYPSKFMLPRKLFPFDQSLTGKYILFLHGIT